MWQIVIVSGNTEYCVCICGFLAASSVKWGKDMGPSLGVALYLGTIYVVSL